MKKRDAKEAELPLAERARRAMMALEQALGDVVPFFDEAAAGQTGPLPIAAELADSAFRLLDRAALVVRPEHVARVELPRLPTEVVQHIFELLTGCRRMSRVGPSGSIISKSLWVIRRPSTFRNDLRSFRLVCRQWARAAGRAVITIAPPPRRPFDCNEIVEAFPNASLLILSHLDVRAASKKYWEECNTLIQLYAKHSARHFYVQLRAPTVRHIKLDNAYLACYLFLYCDRQIVNTAKLPFSVHPTSEYDLSPTAKACFCSASAWNILTYGIPVHVHDCRKARVNYVPSVKFNAPSVELYEDLIPADGISNPLFERENWHNNTFPIFIVVIYANIEKYIQKIKKLCDIAGRESVLIKSFASSSVADIWSPQ